MEASDYPPSLFEGPGIPGTGILGQRIKKISHRQIGAVNAAGQGGALKMYLCWADPCSAAFIFKVKEHSIVRFIT